jgi:hypothetical protein
MTISTLTVFEGDLPNENDPVTFSPRHDALMEYVVDVFAPEMKAISEEINAELIPIAEDLAKVADIFLGAFSAPPVTDIIGARYFDLSASPNVDRIWNGSAWVAVNISSAQTLVAGTSMRNLLSPHGASTLIGPSGNFAKGAFDVTNPLYWESGVTAQGVLATRVSTRYDEAKGEMVTVYDLTGTMTAASAFFGYITAASLHTGLAGQIKTASAFLKVLGPAGGGGGAAQIGTGVRVFLFDGQSRFGNPVTGATETLSTFTQTSAPGGNVRCGLAISGAIGTTINARVEISGLMLETASARGGGMVLREYPLSEALGKGRSRIVVGSSVPHVDFLNVIPVGVSRVTVSIQGLMSNATGVVPRLQLGTGTGTFVSSGYVGGGLNQVGTYTAFPDGFAALNSWASTNVCEATYDLLLVDPATNRWQSDHRTINHIPGNGAYGNGNVALPAALSSIRLTAAAGNLITAATVTLIWEF